MLEAALRSGAHGGVDEAWLRRAFPGQWAALRDLLRLEGEIGGGIRPGATLGPFRVVRLLGRGTSSSVHLAEVRRRVFGLRVGHVVALKVLHAFGAMRPAAKARLRREAKAGRRRRKAWPRRNRR